MMEVKRVELMWGSACGAFAAYKMGPIQEVLEHGQGIFRKAWMRHPLRITAFAAGYYCGTQLPARLFRKFSPGQTGVSNDVYTSKFDYVSRFRIFEDVKPTPGSKEKLLDYLATYSADPLSEPELVDHLMEKITKDFDISELFQVKRVGKDADEIFYRFGKIHGLENIAFIDDEALESTNGNPVALQHLINEVNGHDVVPVSHDAAVHELKESLAKYQAAVDKMTLHSSDRKKLLSLPFYMSKRSELPEPKRGQKEMKIFEEMYGMKWHDHVRTM
jgi:hypothetical protein